MLPIGVKPLAESYIRRVRINDVVHSFCFSCQELGNGQATSYSLFPFVILDVERHEQFRCEWAKIPKVLPRTVLRPFIDYWLTNHPSHISRDISRIYYPVHQLEHYTEDWSVHEWDYAAQLLRKYYAQ